MTFVDASAVIAILNRETGWERLAATIDASRGRRLISPLATFEAAIGLARSRCESAERRPKRSDIAIARAAVQAFVSANDIREIAVTPDVGERAMDAAAQYGKAVGHPASLNFGDCFAYACARAHGAALLYKGDDFSKTDLA